MIRLDKYMAEACVDRRKKVRVLIQDGKVLVNGEVVTEPALIIDEEKDIVTYKGQQVIHNGKVYYMFHKPAGCVTARKDAEHKTVLDYFSKEDGAGIFPVGRLDRDTEGLLLFTNDGEFDHALMHPKQHVDKTYFFWALGALDEEKIKKLEIGLSIGKGEAITLPAKVSVVQAGSLAEIETEINLDDVKKKYKHTGQAGLSGYLTISEGRKHQVKRMLKAVGCYVVYLKRVSIGTVSLDESLKKGEYRQLTSQEVEELFKV